MSEKKLSGNLIDLIMGLAVLGKEKMSPVIEELIRKGNIEKKHAEKYLKIIENKGKEAKEEMEKKIQEEINKFFSKIDFVKKQDFERLEKELLELKKIIKK